MVLRNSGGVAGRSTRRWAVALGGLTTLAVLTTGLSVRPGAVSAAQPEKKVAADKAAAPVKVDPLTDALRKLKQDIDDPEVQKKLDEMIDGLKAGRPTPPAAEVPVAPPPLPLPRGGIGRPDIDREMRQMQEMMRQYAEMMRKGMGQPGAGVGGFAIGPNNIQPLVPGGGVRLGITVERPSDVLASQLDLPPGQGLVCVDVPAGSVAGKAGLRPNDVLLAMGGKPVPSSFPDFQKVLADVKPGTAVDIVVIRKGKKETIKDVKLPEPRPAAEVPGLPALPDLELIPLPLPAAPLAVPSADGPVGPDGAATRVQQVGDAFTVFHSKNGVKVTIAGTKEGGVAQAESIEVDDNGKMTRAESIDKLPKEYQDLARAALAAVK